jgi:hypothetical protein
MVNIRALTFAALAVVMSAQVAAAEDQVAAPAPAPAPVAAAAPEAPAATPTAPASAQAPAPATAASAAADVSSTTVLTKVVPPPPPLKVPAGYTKVNKGLETVYCKTYTPIGSRMPEKICYNEAQLRAIIKQNEINQQEMREKANAGGTNAS